MAGAKEPVIFAECRPGDFIGQIGVAAGLMGSIAKLHDRDIAYFQNWIVPAIQHRQFGLFVTAAGGRPVGMVTWAYLAEDVESRLALDGNYVLHSSEWKEGRNLWLLDFVAPFGHARSMMRHLAHQFVHDDRISWCRTNTLGRRHRYSYRKKTLQTAG